MLRIATASVLANKLRLALTALAVVLGVSFVSGTFVLTDSIDAAFGDLLAEANEGVDAYVNPVEEVDATPGGPGVATSGGALLDESLLAEVRAVDGVATAVGSVEGTAQIVAPDGEPIGGQGPPQLAFSWTDEDGAVTLRQGAPPTAADEVVIDVTSFEDHDFALGEQVTIVGPEGPREFTLTGVVGFGEEDNLLGATLALFTLDTAQELFDKQGSLDQVVVAAEDGTEVPALIDDLTAAVGGEDVEVVSAADQQQQDQQEIAAGLAFLDAILLSFAAVALFVGAFLIVNTFSIIVAQRTREFALLRAVGASARQVRRVVVLEALAVGLFGGAAGLAGGVGLSVLLRSLFGAIGADFPDGGIVLAPRTIIASFAIAIVVTVVAALAPARRAAKVAPVEALRGTGIVDSERIGATRTVGGGLLVAVGALLLALGLAGVGTNEVVLVGGGVAALFVGVALVAPWIARPVTAAFGVLLGTSVVARLARANAARNPGRTSATASALMIGVALVTFISILAASITASLGVLFEEQFGADLLVTNGAGFGTVATEFVDEVREVDGLASVSTERFVQGEDADGDGVTLVGVDSTVIGEHYQLGADDGALAALDRGGVMLEAELAADLDVAAGDSLELTVPARADVELEVVGTFENADVLGAPYVIDVDTYEQLVGDLGAPAFVSLRVAEDADRAAVRTAVEDITAGYPGLTVQDVGEVLAQTEAQVDGLLNVMIGLLALALVIAVIGIVNTLALSVLERTREIGLLRAVGMLRSQVRRTVRAEAVLVALFGGTMGIALGVGFGWALVTALADDGIGELVLPGGRLLVYLLGAGIAGVLAAVLPARRAARLDVLTAVTAE